MSKRANWTVYRVTLTNANTEYSQLLPEDVLFVHVSTTSQIADVRLSLVASQVEGGTQYRTISAGTGWESQMPIIGAKTIYLSSDTAGIEVEIEVWY